MPTLNAVAIVEAFWTEVWQSPQNPEAVDDFVTEDFIITSGGVDMFSRAAFKAWVIGFQQTISGLEFELIESFQNADGNRVASRFRIRGRNNGFLGCAPDQRPITFTGTAVWAVRADGKLLHNWVERSAWEAYQHLTNATPH
jgi:hypothetical protein